MSDELFRQIEYERPSIPGWCSAVKSRRLAEIVLMLRPMICVEIGVFGGSSLIPQALALKHLGRGKIIGIDAWKTDVSLEFMTEPANIHWWSQTDLQDMLAQCKSRISRLGIDSFCELWQSKSCHVADKFSDNSIGVIHFDGNHSEECSMNDVCLYLPKVRPGGYIIFDDISWTENSIQTTRAALDYMLRNGCDKCGGEEDWLILRKGESTI